MAIIESKDLDTLIIPILGDIRDANNLKYVFEKFLSDEWYMFLC